MNRPKPILIGFFPKRTARPDPWFGETSVEEICSVSGCISKAPENWIRQWKHNLTWWLYDTEEIAWSVVSDDRGLYGMYAYKIFPLVLDGRTESPITVESTALGNLSDFEFLGYDAVSRERDVPEFCHSPLSCNKGFEKYRVNRCCLIDTWEEALRVAREIARDAKEMNAWEPGPYYLCEVHRKRRSAGNLTGRAGTEPRP